MAGSDNSQINFKSLIQLYNTLQSQVVMMVKSISQHTSSATPSAFLMLQFQMSQITQIGESISNMVSQVNSMINNSIRNQKSS